MARTFTTLYDLLSFVTISTHTTRFMLSRYLAVTPAHVAQMVTRAIYEKWINEVDVGGMRILHITATGFNLINIVRPDDYPRYIPPSRLLNMSIAHNLLTQYVSTAISNRTTLSSLYFDKYIDGAVDSNYRPDAQLFFSTDQAPAFIDIEFARGKMVNRIYRRFFDCYSSAELHDGVSFIVFNSRQILNRYLVLYNEPTWPTFAWSESRLVPRGTFQITGSIRERLKLMHITDIDKQPDDYRRIK